MVASINILSYLILNVIYVGRDVDTVRLVVSTAFIHRLHHHSSTSAVTGRSVTDRLRLAEDRRLGQLRHDLVVRRRQQLADGRRSRQRFHRLRLRQSQGTRIALNLIFGGSIVTNFPRGRGNCAPPCPCLWAPVKSYENVIVLITCFIL